MSILLEVFDERLSEVRAYLDFLSSMEAETQSGAPRFHHSGHAITPQQQKLLYAGVYLQLYNLVEATISLCIESVAGAASDGARWTPHDLSDAIRREWVRSTARTHKDLSFSTRLDAAVQLVEHLLESEPVAYFTIEKGGGGNWDDRAIERMSERLGCKLALSRRVKRSVKKPIKDDLGALALVRRHRNDLAHGSVSFTQSAEQVTVRELKELADAVTSYLTEVVDHFTAFVAGHEFLLPDRRPVALP